MFYLLGANTIKVRNREDRRTSADFDAEIFTILSDAALTLKLFQRIFFLKNAASTCTPLSGMHTPFPGALKNGAYLSLHIGNQMFVRDIYLHSFQFSDSDRISSENQKSGYY